VISLRRYTAPQAATDLAQEIDGHGEQRSSNPLTSDGVFLVLEVATGGYDPANLLLSQPPGEVINDLTF